MKKLGSPRQATATRGGGAGAGAGGSRSAATTAAAKPNEVVRHERACVRAFRIRSLLLGVVCGWFLLS